MWWVVSHKERDIWDINIHILPYQVENLWNWPECEIWLVLFQFVARKAADILGSDKDGGQHWEQDPVCEEILIDSEKKHVAVVQSSFGAWFVKKKKKK